MAGPFSLVLLGGTAQQLACPPGTVLEAAALTQPGRTWEAFTRQSHPASSTTCTEPVRRENRC